MHVVFIYKMDRSEVATSPSDSEVVDAKRPTHYLIVPAAPLLASLIKSNYLVGSLFPVDRIQRLNQAQKLDRFRAKAARLRQSKQTRKAQTRAYRACTSEVSFSNDVDIGDDITM